MSTHVVSDERIEGKASMIQMPRVLVVSHNVFSDTTGMGRTMADMLSCVPKENLAQMYFRPEVPSMKTCRRYFRVTDMDVLRSLLSRKSNFTAFDKNVIFDNNSELNTENSVEERAYQFSRKRTPIIYLGRNLLWKLGKWKSRELDAWINDFGPDVIFFASGGHPFSYRIAYQLSMTYHIPIVLWCCDDYYLNSGSKKGALARYYHHNLMQWVREVSERTAQIVVIGEKMKKAYGSIFSQPINVLRISAAENPYVCMAEKRQGIIYAGGLGVSRATALIELGKVLRSAGLYIDVYSGEKNEQTLKLLTEENGIRFHGKIPYEQVRMNLGAAKFVLHIEAFDEETREKTRYSLSTKIGDALRSGACIIAYGPSDIESIEYLTRSNAAVVLRSAAECLDVIGMLEQNLEEYQRIVECAMKLANGNHNKSVNDMVMTRILTDSLQIE